LTTVQTEIAGLEERLREAELGPDPDFFEEVLADDAVMVSDGEPAFAKATVVEAHRPGSKPKFTGVHMSDMQITDHGAAAVVTCRGTYETGDSRVTLKFMRVWLKTENGWRIIAGSISK